MGGDKSFGWLFVSRKGLIRSVDFFNRRLSTKRCWLEPRSHEAGVRGEGRGG